jgi:hypothetical protein
MSYTNLPTKYSVAPTATTVKPTGFITRAILAGFTNNAVTPAASATSQLLTSANPFPFLL